MSPSAAEYNARPLPPALSWMLPNLSTWLWLILFIVLLADPQRTKLVSSDGDANMHWRVGEHMLQTREIIRTDAFSHTMPGAKVVSKEWLSQILFALAGRLQGLTGLSVLAAIVLASSFALLHRQLRREGADVLVATILVMVGVWASVPHWHARPHVFSLLMLVLWNGALRRFDRHGSAKELGISLGVLTLLWVNLHGGYLAGFIVLGCYWLGTAIEWRCANEQAARAEYNRKWRMLTWAGLVCIAVSLINPNGIHLHVHNLQFVRSAFFVNWLDEYSSTNFHEPGSRGFLVWLAVLFLAIVLRRPRLAASSWIVLITWSYFALYAVRNISFLIILSAPILATVLSDMPHWWQKVSQRIARVDASNQGWAAIVVVGIGCLLFLKLPTSMPSQSWPVDAVAEIRRHPEQFQGNMLNLYGWGGYLLRALPEHKVFVDGRADFYGESLVKEYDEVDELRPQWQTIIDKYSVRWTLLPADHRLNLALALLPQWRRVYTDGVATMYQRNE